MLIPAETIKKIQEEADIVEVIGEKVKLDKKGANYVGLCPFHDDKNPSLTVSPTKKIYTCFSCGATGNVITFIQNYEKVSFVEAASRLAKKVGINLNIGDVGSTSQIHKKYYDLIEKATNFYEFYLNNTTEGRDALNYLYKRGLNDKIIKRFRIGLAPRDSDRLYKALLQDKHQPLDMIEAGLVKSGSGGYYDYFRGRIMFPLGDTSENIAGFSGRIYREGDNEAKYLNSGENHVFKKSQILYNFTLAYDEIRKSDAVYIFEGFLDVIAAYRAGITNTLAVMGTAFTGQQVAAIKRLTTNIILCFDGDEAGRTASRKAIYILTKEGISCKALLLPDKYDPDDYFNKYGGEAFASFLRDKQLSGIDFLYEIEKENLIPDDIISIEDFKKSLFRHLNFFNSQVINEIYLNKAAEYLRISVESLREDFKKTAYRPRNAGYKPAAPIKRKAGSNKYANSEKALIKSLIYHRDKYLEAKERLTSYVTGNRRHRSIIYKLFDYYKNNDTMNINEFKSCLDQEEALVFAQIIESSAIGVYAEITELIDNIQSYKYYEKTMKIREETLTEENLEELRQNKKTITVIKLRSNRQ